MEGDIVTAFSGVLGEMSEDAFDLPAHLGVSPRPEKAKIYREIFRGLAKRSRPVVLPDRRGFPGEDIELLMEDLRGYFS